MFDFLEDWCSFGSDHTMCMYTGISSACKDVTARGDEITDEEKTTVVDKHNEYRRKVAALEAGDLPKAASMPLALFVQITRCANTRAYRPLVMM